MHLAAKDDRGGEAEVVSGWIKVVVLNLPLNTEAILSALQRSAVPRALSPVIIDAVTTSVEEGVKICACRVVLPVIVRDGRSTTPDFYTRPSSNCHRKFEL
jgi:hypothetical protein